MKRHLRLDDSSNVVSAAYDGDSNKLTVEFTSGAAYEYANVQPHQFAELAGAKSAGQWIRTAIIKQPEAYPCTKVRDKAAPGTSKLERYEAALQLIGSAEVSGKGVTSVNANAYDRLIVLAQEALK